jgi:RNA polymerase primary sigma factor
MATPPNPLVMLRVTDIGDELVEQALMRMTEREQEIVRLRLGIGDNRVDTVEEVGDMFSVTKERVRQIEMKFGALLRHPMPSPLDVA